MLRRVIVPALVPVSEVVAVHVEVVATNERQDSVLRHLKLVPIVLLVSLRRPS